jgi:anti-sigma factor RsiW
MQPENRTKSAGEETDLPHIGSIAQTLTAYLDGELSEPLREIMDARIATEPALRTLVEELEAGKAIGLDLFETLSHAPVPPRLTRFTRSA